MRDEFYVIDLCDQILGYNARRQARFDFLRGDPGKNSIGRRLPLDAYYEKHSLVIEYRELQHSKPVAHFDKPSRLTVSGVTRGEQRRIYDERRRAMLPQYGIKLVEINYYDLVTNTRGRLKQEYATDFAAIVQILQQCKVVPRS